MAVITDVVFSFCYCMCALACFCSRLRALCRHYCLCMCLCPSDWMNIPRTDFPLSQIPRVVTLRRMHRTHVGFLVRKPTYSLKLWTHPLVARIDKRPRKVPVHATELLRWLYTLTEILYLGENAYRLPKPWMCAWLQTCLPKPWRRAWLHKQGNTVPNRVTWHFPMTQVPGKFVKPLRCMMLFLMVLHAWRHTSCETPTDACLGYICIVL